MGIILFLFFAVITALLLTKAYDGHLNKWRTTKLFAPVAVLVSGLLISVTQPYKFERVDAGCIGIIVKNFGVRTGVQQTKKTTGLVLINNWTEKLVEIPTFLQQIAYDKQSVTCKGGLPLDIHPTMSMQIKESAADDMYVNLRKPVDVIIQEWLMNAIVGSINDVANRWVVENIFDNKEKFEAEIVIEVNKRTSKWFTISNLRTGIAPPTVLVNSIAAKSQAIQAVQVAENQKLTAIAEGETKIAIARADSARLVIAAAGEAEAVRRKQLTLTPLYIDFMKIEKWDGALPYYSGAGSPIINMK